jgi:D,D-heptose 1,7-bisphosphate phosphatase
LLADGAGDGPEVLARMVAREVADTSRFGLLTMDGDQVRAFSERGGPHPGLINGGIYLLDRRIVAETREICSLERDVLPRLAQAGQVRATIGAGYFIDIGIPDDLRRAERELPSVLRRRALFLDRDGTINIDYGWVGSRRRWEFVAGAEDAIRMATAAGWHVFIVTNQSGIARGFYDVADVEALHAWVGDAVRQRGGTIDDVRIAPHHPSAIRPEFRGDSDWRKPKPGMLLDLLRAWRLDPARCIMVGDQTSDIAAATAAGVAGYRFPGGNLADFVAPLLDGRND